MRGLASSVLEIFCVFHLRGVWRDILDEFLIVLPQFGSGLKFQPEPFRTGPKFSSKFKGFAELNRKFSSGFRQMQNYVNLFEPVWTDELVHTTDYENYLWQTSITVSGPPCQWCFLVDWSLPLLVVVPPHRWWLVLASLHHRRLLPIVVEGSPLPMVIPPCWQWLPIIVGIVLPMVVPPHQWWLPISLHGWSSHRRHFSGIVVVSPLLVPSYVDTM